MENSADSNPRPVNDEGVQAMAPGVRQLAAAFEKPIKIKAAESCCTPGRILSGAFFTKSK